VGTLKTDDREEVDIMAKQDLKALLAKYLATKTLLRQNTHEGMVYYTFADWVKDEPDERRTGQVNFNVTKTDGSIHMYRRVAKEQKFLCVNGPLAGQKLTDADAPEYVVFNRAIDCRSDHNPAIPKAVLIHRGSFAKKSKKPR